MCRRSIKNHLFFTLIFTMFYIEFFHYEVHMFIEFLKYVNIEIHIDELTCLPFQEKKFLPSIPLLL